MRYQYSLTEHFFVNYCLSFSISIEFAMLWNMKVKLTIAIEDIREVERKRLLGIEDPDAPTREELAAVLEEVRTTF